MNERLGCGYWDDDVKDEEEEDYACHKYANRFVGHNLRFVIHTTITPPPRGDNNT